MQETPAGDGEPAPVVVPPVVPDDTDGDGEHPHRRRRRALKIIGGSLAVLLIVLVVGGFVVYRQLNANLTSAPLNAGIDPTPAQTPYVDPYGRQALNILVIGSDTRDGKANCEIGHACNSVSTNIDHADVELLVHVSADRSNATALSIPRDTVTDLPGCRDTRDRKNQRVIAARRGQINATLEYGPGCTVAAVQKLTGLTIDHFVMADFVGVIKMSDAIGGASVCVTGNIYDPLSHLKLSKGRHTVKGEAALQFVRTRHGLGDGSDLGRTTSQHLFLSAVIRKMKSHGTLLNPVKVLGLAQAATKALTVDESLASVNKLVGLAGTIRDVPADRITFVTMPNQPDPGDSNRVVAAPAAERLFRAMLKDRPLTAADAESAAEATPGATPGTTAEASPETSVPETTATPRTSKKTQQALDEGHASTASDENACAQVSTLSGVLYEGRYMTPAEAYRLSSDIPDSAE